MARSLIVRRKKTRLVAEKAVFSIYVDGEKKFSISNGEAKEIEISDDEHTIQVINDTSLDKETGEMTKDTQYTDILTIPAGNEAVDFLMELKPMSRRTIRLQRIK